MEAQELLSAEVLPGPSLPSKHLSPLSGTYTGLQCSSCLLSPTGSTALAKSGDPGGQPPPPSPLVGVEGACPRCQLEGAERLAWVRAESGGRAGDAWPDNIHSQSGPGPASSLPGSARVTTAKPRVRGPSVS